jgi:hypothetical protein
MKEYTKPELEVVSFATEAIAENGGEGGNIDTYDNDGGL